MKVTLEVNLLKNSIRLSKHSYAVNNFILQKLVKLAKFKRDHDGGWHGRTFSSEVHIYKTDIGKTSQKILI